MQEHATLKEPPSCRV